MPKRNIEDVYDILYSMLETADKLIEQANNLTTSVTAYGGDLKRVIQEQMGKYFIPAMRKLKDDENTPGCIKAQITYLDSIPLWQTRVEADPAADYQPNPAELPTPEISMPASSTIDQTQEIPRGTSYQNPQGIQEAKEKKEKREYSKYRIYRKSKSLSSLGKEGKIEPTAVAEYNSKREAECHCRGLNDSITPEEKSMLGTEYFVKEEKFEDNLIKA